MESETPSGWRWLGRMGLLVLVCLLVAAAAWGLWWREAQRRCDASIAAIQARGEPVRWTEFVLEPEPPAQQNAVWYLTQALTSFRGVPGAGTTRPVPGTPPWQSAAERDVAANSTALDLLRKARACKLASWGSTRDQYGHPPIPSLTSASALARLVRDKALLHHARGQEQQAVECWQDIEAQWRIIGGRGGRPTSLIGGLVGLIVHGIGLEAMERIAPEIRRGGPDGLDSDAVRALIAQLEQDHDLRESVAQAFLCERLNFTNVWMTGLLDRGPWLLRPMVMLQCQRAWDEFGKLAESIRNCTEMTERVPRDQDKLFAIVPQFMGNTNQVIGQVLRRRVAAVTLAVQLYRHERGGYPASLAQLVPGYLHAVPADPRGGNSRPLGYLLTAGGRRPLVYSAGSSKPSADEVTRGVPAQRTDRSPDVYWPSFELVFFDVSAWAGDRPSTAQGGDDQPQKSDHPRNQD